MGLDNGIILKTKKKLTTEDVPAYINFSINEEWGNECEYEIVYFRKFWGYRNAVVLQLNMHTDEYECKLNREDIQEMANELKKFFALEHWNNTSANSVWDWDDYIVTMVHQWYNLQWLLNYWDKHEDNIEEVYFYDSY